MARFYGPVGFDLGEHEDPENPGVWISTNMTEKNYYGTILKHNRRWDNGESVNDDLTVTNRISIVADDYARKYCSGIRYVHWMNANWKVVSFDVQRPRIILNLGGVWNGDTAGTSRSTAEPCSACLLSASCDCQDGVSVHSV